MQQLSKQLVKKEATDALIFIVSNSVLQFGNLVIIPIFWYRLTPEDFGIIAITEIIGSFLSIFLGLSLEESINKFYYEWSENERKRGIGAVWIASWISSLIIGFISIYLLSWLSRYIFEKVDFFPYIFLGLIGTILTSFGKITFTTIRIKRRPIFYAIWSFSGFIIFLFFRVFFVFVQNEGLVGYYKANILSAAIIVLIGIIIMLKFSNPCLWNSGLKKCLKFSLPIIPSSIITGLATVSDRLILQNYVSLSSLGIYSLSLKFAAIITGFHDGLKLSYGPFLWQTINEKGNPKNTIAQMAPIFAAPLFLLTFAVSIFSGEIILLINRPSFFSVSEYIPAVAGFTLINCLYIYFSPGIMLGGRTDLLWIPSTARLVAVFSGIFLVLQYGVFGIIVAKYFSSLVYFGISFYISQKVLFLPHKFKSITLITVSYIILFLIFIFIDFDDRWINVSLKISIFIAYCLTIYLILFKKKFDLQLNDYFSAYL